MSGRVTAVQAHVTCDACGKDIASPRLNQRFCSNDCRFDYHLARRQAAMQLAERRKTQPDANLMERWWTWHQANPRFWELFEGYAKQAVKAGRVRFSAWMIVNRIRWYTTIETHGEPYKISNDFIACFARLFVYLYPTAEHLFQIKKAPRLNGFYAFLQEKLKG